MSGAAHAESQALVDLAHELCERHAFDFAALRGELRAVREQLRRIAPALAELGPAAQPVRDLHAALRAAGLGAVLAESAEVDAIGARLDRLTALLAMLELTAAPRRARAPKPDPLT